MIFISGEYQPLAFNDLLVPCLILCSHIHAALFWLSAIKNPSKFLAVNCDSLSETRRGNCYKNDNIIVNELGMNTNFSAPGIYYLPTREIYPYYKGKDGLKDTIHRHYAFILNAVIDDDIIV